MKERDRIQFQALVRKARSDGLSITEAIELAYRWLLKPSKEVW